MAIDTYDYLSPYVGGDLDGGVGANLVIVETYLKAVVVEGIVRILKMFYGEARRA